MKKILIVDDEPNIVMALEFAFRKANHQVFIARDGKEALESVSHNKPDLVIMDIMMPLVNGYETLELMKNDPRTHQIEVVLLSARNKADDIQKGLDFGAAAYVTKPFSIKKLIKQCEELLHTDA